MTDELFPPEVDADWVAGLRRYVAEKVVPVADRIDREDIYPVELMKDIARAGYSAITMETSLGGASLSYSHAVAALEEIAVGSAAVGVSLITVYQAQSMIRFFGEQSLKDRYLPMFARGLLCSYALTESTHGSDIRRLDTKGHRDGDGWIIDGEKHFITSGAAAELFVILAETPVGVSAFAVPRETAGIEIYEGHNSATFGLRNGPHMNVRFNKVRVPADHMIGTEGKGVRQAVTVLDYSRTLAGAISVGIARSAFESSMAFARDRVAFDQRVLEFQGIQWYFAEMLSEIDAARLLIYRAARALDRHEQIDRWSSEAKLVASAMATKVSSLAVQVCGAYGVMENSPYGRFLRDAKAYEIAGGSSEVLKNTIAKFLLPVAGLQARRKAPGT
jgi:alkylation response protein AidB-like acyl-CoA dehydrogenase